MHSGVVYVIDDDPSVRGSLKRLLASSGRESRVFASAEEFLSDVTRSPTGCLILDMKMPGISGLDLQQKLESSGINLPIIFLTGYGTIPASVRAMKAGAVDFLEKPVDAEMLLDSVQKAIEKNRQNNLQKSEIQSIEERVASLSPREYQVFCLVVLGMLNKQVAFELNVAEKTIKVHRARIMEKMKANSLADLVRFAERLGIGASKNPSPLG
jgi:FixJ family two-component response regulator